MYLECKKKNDPFYHPNTEVVSLCSRGSLPFLRLTFRFPASDTWMRQFWTLKSLQLEWASARIPDEGRYGNFHFWRAVCTTGTHLVWITLVPLNSVYFECSFGWKSESLGPECTRAVLTTGTLSPVSILSLTMQLLKSKIWDGIAGSTEFRDAGDLGALKNHARLSKKRFKNLSYLPVTRHASTCIIQPCFGIIITSPGTSCWEEICSMTSSFSFFLFTDTTSWKIFMSDFTGFGTFRRASTRGFRFELRSSTTKEKVTQRNLPGLLRCRAELFDSYRFAEHQDTMKIQIWW